MRMDSFILHQLRDGKIVEDWVVRDTFGLMVQLGVIPMAGRCKLRQLAEWDSTLNSHLEIETLSVSGDTVLRKVTGTNDWFDASVQAAF